MAQKETIINLEEILEELKASEGLPENLSTEAQLWDEILKKETFLMPEQLFPLIKEIYGKSYPKGAPQAPRNGVLHRAERHKGNHFNPSRRDSSNRGI